MRAGLLTAFRLLLCCATLNFNFISSALAKAPVWKVSKGNHSVFLGGTIHVLSAKDYPLPDAFDRAFEQSQQVIFEIDINRMGDPQVMQKVTANLMFQDERTLDKVLSENTYAKLGKFLQQRGLSIEQFNKFKPIGISLSLVVLEMQALGISDGLGVDQFYHRRAAKEGKEITALETIEEQMLFISQVGEGDADALIESTLQELKNLTEDWQFMYKAWRSGDSGELQELLIEPMLQEFPAIYKLLLVERNNNWMKKIKPMFTTKEVEFILVGALHMVGKDGLLEQLSKLGYSVEQLE